MNIDKYKEYSFQNLSNGNQTYCQITKKKNLVEAIDLGDQPLADSLIEKKDLNKHYFLESHHPSPLSANKGGWFGTKHFSKTNTILKTLGKTEIDWN